MRKAARFAGSKKRRAAGTVRGNFDRGYNAGYNRGYNRGFDAGVSAGRSAFHAGFEGTSIIVPTMNQRELLVRCIESIRLHTPEPHELIVIDNGSSDGTSDYLRSQTGQLRYKVYQEPLGFAGAVNQGLRMSRGSTVMFLNNDTVVTRNWLRNMLNCLMADPDRRLVGPVTNYISGEQKMSASYSGLEEMHRFAANHNVSDSSLWVKTGRLTGFCVLMTRGTLERLGFLDEGFEAGNCEDDDYGLRARLLGIDLVIARDTFIHHEGSVSMNSLGEDRLQRVNEHNMGYFAYKWTQTPALLETAVQAAAHRILQGSDYYPTGVFVEAAGGGTYWLEQGVRHAVTGAELPPVRLSRMALRRIPRGEDWSLERLRARLAELSKEPGLSHAEAIPEGALAVSPAGTRYQFSQGTLRIIANACAEEKWGLAQRRAWPISEEQEQALPRGLPILPPEIIKAGNL